MLKYWNATSDYPYYSYELETQIADLDFNNDNYENGFLYAIRNLSTIDLPDWASNTVGVLKTIGKWIT